MAESDCDCERRGLPADVFARCKKQKENIIRGKKKRTKVHMYTRV